MPQDSRDYFFRVKYSLARPLWDAPNPKPDLATICCAHGSVT